MRFGHGAQRSGAGQHSTDTRPPATGTAKTVCRPMATNKGDSACVLDCSEGVACPDRMVRDRNTNCFWPPWSPERERIHDFPVSFE